MKLHITQDILKQAHSLASAAISDALDYFKLPGSPGDPVLADQNGFVVIPAARAEEVLARALAMHEVEQRIVAAGLAGMKLSEARRQFGHHALQRSPAQQED